MGPCYLNRLSSSLQSLQRPLPVYELDMYSRDAVGAGGARANRGKSGHAVLIARDSNEAADRNIERGEKRCALVADVLSHCLFACDHGLVLIEQLDAHIDSDVVPCLSL